MFDQATRSFRQNGNHVHYAFGKPTSSNHRASSSAVSGVARWLEYTSTARGHPAPTPRRHHQRIIPRIICPDPHRLFQRELIALSGPDLHSNNLGCQAAVIFETRCTSVMSYSPQQLACPCCGIRVRQAWQILPHLFGEAKQHAPAFLCRRRRPRPLQKPSWQPQPRVHVVGIRVGNLRITSSADGSYTAKVFVDLLATHSPLINIEYFFTLASSTAKTSAASVGTTQTPFAPGLHLGAPGSFNVVYEKRKPAKR